MNPEHPWMWWPWGSMWIFPIVMFVIMFICFFLFSRFGGFRPPWWGSGEHRKESGGSDTALDILKKRYAKGEITKEEFDRMKKDILS